MPWQGTAGQLLIDRALPEELRGRALTLDKSGVAGLLREIAEKYPEKYREVSKKLMDLGQEAATESGSMAFGLDDLQQTPGAAKLIEEIRQGVDRILASSTLQGAQRKKAIIDFVGSKHKTLMDTVYDESLAKQNPLTLSVLSGARGNKMNINSLMGADLLYEDHKQNAIPFPVLKSYSQGLSPAEYMAGAFGARMGVVSTKLATADGGFFGKQLNQAAHRQIVVAEDEDDDDRDEETLLRGLPVDADDTHNIGALLAHDVAGFPRNTTITPKVLNHIRAAGVKRFLVRSPLTGGTEDGGLYARDVGVQEGGMLPGIGEFVGNRAAQALAEPITQGALCLAEGTLVRMADWTVRPIEQIQPGEWVLGSDHAGNIFAVRVKARYDNGERECVATSFKVAATQEVVELRSTKDHKILGVARRWHPETELVDPGVWPVGERCVRLCARMPEQILHDGGTKEEPYSWLLGLLLGDGCYTISVHGVHLSCFDPSLIRDIEPKLARLGLRITLLAGQRGYYRISQVKDSANLCPETGRFLPGARNPVLKKLQDLGWWGKYAHEKELPNDIWAWKTADLLELLGGLFATDGSVYTSKNRAMQSAAYLAFGSTSLNLARGFRELLRVRLGVWPSVLHMNTQGRKRPLYSFTVTRRKDVVKLAKLLAPHVPGVKKQKLEAIADGYKTDRDINFLYRKTQKAIGLLPTYDLEVDHPDHLFLLANGLIVSNSTKHSGGVAGQAKTVSGFQYINSLIQIPKTMKGGAVHAEADGVVQRVSPSPSGGFEVVVGDKVHYVNPGVDVKVKVGDSIEAGDQLSSGIPNPAKVVEHKGIGEGARYFVNAFRTAMSEMGLKGERRNVEVVAKGLINHVRLTDEFGAHVPDDIVPYGWLERHYAPREGFQKAQPQQALDKYLERPVLHYSIGTKIRPSVVRDLEEFGIKEIPVHDEPPPFKPEMIRAMYNLHNDPDPLTKMYGSGLKGSLLDSVHRGAVSDKSSTSFVPSLAEGKDFGQVGAVRRPGPKIAPPEPPGMPKLGAPCDDLLEKTAIGSTGTNKTKDADLSPPAAPKAPTAPAAPAKPANQAPPGLPSFANALKNSDEFLKNNNPLTSLLGQVEGLDPTGTAKDLQILTRGNRSVASLNQPTAFGTQKPPALGGMPAPVPPLRASAPSMTQEQISEAAKTDQLRERTDPGAVKDPLGPLIGNAVVAGGMTAFQAGRHAWKNGFLPKYTGFGDLSKINKGVGSVARGALAFGKNLGFTPLTAGLDAVVDMTGAALDTRDLGERMQEQQEVSNSNEAASRAMESGNVVGAAYYALPQALRAMQPSVALNSLAIRGNQGEIERGLNLDAKILARRARHLSWLRDQQTGEAAKQYFTPDMWKPGAPGDLHLSGMSNGYNEAIRRLQQTHGHARVQKLLEQIRQETLRLPEFDPNSVIGPEQ